MLRFRLSDLPESLQKQALAKLSRETTPKPSKEVVRKPRVRDTRSSQFDSKAEEEFFYNVLQGKAIVHPLTLHTLSGGRYTPDFLAYVDGVPTLFEIKGSYRLHSQDGANRRFLEAASEFGEIFAFVWAVKEKGGSWSIKKTLNRLDTPESSAEPEKDAHPSQPLQSAQQTQTAQTVQTVQTTQKTRKSLQKAQEAAQFKSDSIQTSPQILQIPQSTPSNNPSRQPTSQILPASKPSSEKSANPDTNPTITAKRTTTAKATLSVRKDW